MRLDDIGPLIVLVVLGTVVAGMLVLLARFWDECRTDTARARERVQWPTATVAATLVDVTYRSRRVNRPLNAIGRYAYAFGGITQTTERYEEISGTDEEVRAAGERLRAAGKTIELEVQYNPDDRTEVSDRIVTEVPSCRWWVGGFLILAAVLMALILRGLARLLLR